jgi:hypothetical protein
MGPLSAIYALEPLSLEGGAARFWVGAQDFTAQTWGKLPLSGELLAAEPLAEPGAKLALARELSTVGKLPGIGALAAVRTLAKSGVVFTAEPLFSESGLRAAVFAFTAAKPELPLAV